MYRYKDFVTGKIRWTHGRFAGWRKDGPLGARGVVFKNPRSELWIPEYLLTKETRAELEDLPFAIAD